MLDRKIVVSSCFECPYSKTLENGICVCTLLDRTLEMPQVDIFEDCPLEENE